MKKVVALLAVVGIASAGGWYVANGGGHEEASEPMDTSVEFNEFVASSAQNQGSKDGKQAEKTPRVESEAPSEDKSQNTQSGSEEQAPTDIKVLSVEREDRDNRRETVKPSKDYRNVKNVRIDDDMRAANQVSPEVLRNLDLDELRPKVPPIPEGVLKNIRRDRNSGRTRR